MMRRMMRRPLVGIAVCVVLGTWLGLTVARAPVALIGCGIFLIACLVSLFLHAKLASLVGLYGLVVLVAWFHAASANDMSIEAALTVGNEPRNRVELTGRVLSDVVDVPGKGGMAKVLFSIRAERLIVAETDHRVSDDVRVVMYGIPRHPPVYGEAWRFTGRLSPSRNRQRGQQLRYTLITGLADAERQSKTQSAFMAWCFEARKRAAALLTSGIEEHPDVSGVVNALLLGYRAQLPRSVRDCFMHTGTMHVFAISGLHVGILCTIIVFVLGALRLPRTAWVLALGPLICTYTCVTGARASAIRASAMAVTYLLAPLVGRRADAVTAFALAATAILAWQPTQLVDMGFLYSFVVVAGIMAIVPIFDAWLKPLWQRDPLTFPEMEEEGIGWRRHALKLVIRMCAVSAAAWLTSMPLSLHFFGRFSPVALLGNFVALPLAFFILVTGCLSLAAGMVAEGLSQIFNHANWSFVRMLVGGMQGLERIPYGWAEGPKVPMWAVLLWYMMLIAGVAALRSRLGKRKTESRNEDPESE
jgi:ComEC/Rec2-related protein